MTVERFDPPAAGKQLALVNPTTDSWTAVLSDVIDLARGINGTEFVPVGLRGSVEKVTAAVLHGRELGLPPMTALAHTSVINGRTGISAEVMRALILQAGHDLQIDVSDSQRCTIRGRRRDWATDRWTTVAWTIQDAAKAGLLEDKRSRDGKITPSMYKKWPAAMLLARATTTLARMVFADVIHGMRSVEELQEWIDAEVVESIPAPPATAQVSRQSTVGAAPADEPTTAVGAPVEADPEQPRPASTTGRKRAPLTKRGTKATPPPAEPTQAAQAAQGEAQPSLDQTDAEVVDSDEGDPDATPTHPDSVDEVKAALRKRTMATVQMQYERLLGKPVDRAQRLRITSAIVGRPVESTTDLSPAELGQVLAKLERTRDRDALMVLDHTAGGES